MSSVEDIVRRALCLIVFAIAFWVRLDFIGQKEGLNCDEVMSIMISNYSDTWKNNYDENATYTGKQIKELNLWNNPSIADAFSDVKKLYVDNRDRPHTNLYYSCLRLWFAGVVATDLRKIIDRGCGLNLLFFVFSFFFLYKLLRRLLDDWLLIPFSLLVAFSNGGSISNAVFMRPYPLQETLLIMFTYLFVRLCEDVENRKQLSNSKNYCKFIPVVGLTLLSGYFAAIYVLILMGVLAYFCKKTKKKENLKFVGVSFLASVLFARALYNKFFHGFTCGRAGAAFKKFGYSEVFDNIVASCDAFFNILQDHWLIAPVLWIVFLVAIIFPRRQYDKADKKILIIFASCFVWSFGVMALAPYKILRYVMPCFALMSLIVPCAISNAKGIYRYFLMVAISSLCVASFSSRFAKVDNLFVNQEKQFEFFTKKPNVPVLILTKEIWKYSRILHQFSDVQLYEFPRSKESLEEKLQKYGSAIVLFLDDYSQEEIQSLIPENFNATASGVCDSFSWRELSTR